MSATAVPTAIVSMVQEIRGRGIAAAARCVVIHSRSDDNCGGARVSIPCPPKLDRAAPRRLATFAAGRYCACCAAKEAGETPFAELEIGEHGGPIWPTGITGSITHSDAFAAAVIAPRPALTGVGIDYEPVVSYDVAEQIERLVFADRREVLLGRQVHFSLSWPELVTLTFSAKESLYKALRPAVGRFFEFHDARLTGMTATTVTLQLETDLGGPFRIGRTFTTRYSFGDGSVATAIAVFDNRFSTAP